MAELEQTPFAEFVPFRFNVVLYAEDRSQPLCRGRFSEVTGLELSVEPYAIREGGRNWGEHQRSGMAKFAPIVLKRGVTEVNDLWSWVDVTSRGANYGYRLQGEIEVLRQVGAAAEPILVWQLADVLPTKFKGPDLSSTASQVAIEEVTMVHEGLELSRPGGAT